MPISEIAQYGVGTFAIAGLIYVVSLFVNNYNKKRSDEDLKSVIENNTSAINNLTELMRAIQLNLVEQSTKIDELLERARR
jgi:sensor domain CHASE-containing protein